MSNAFFYSTNSRVKNTVLFDADVEWLRGAVIGLHCSVHVGVEEHDHALKFMLETKLWEHLEDAVSADQVKRLKPATGRIGVNIKAFGRKLTLFFSAFPLSHFSS